MDTQILRKYSRVTNSSEKQLPTEEAKLIQVMQWRIKVQLREL